MMALRDGQRRAVQLAEAQMRPQSARARRDHRPPRSRSRSWLPSRGRDGAAVQPLRSRMGPSWSWPPRSAAVARCPLPGPALSRCYGEQQNPSLALPLLMCQQHVSATGPPKRRLEIRPRPGHALRNCVRCQPCLAQTLQQVVATVGGASATLAVATGAGEYPPLAERVR